jgi:hypothetical protein
MKITNALDAGLNKYTHKDSVNVYQIILEIFDQETVKSVIEEAITQLVFNLLLINRKS